MNTKFLTFLGVGTLAFVAGAGMCWVLPGGFRARAFSNQSPAVGADRELGVGKVFSGLLNASAEAFEAGTSPEGMALLFTAMSHPQASPQEFEESFRFAVSRASTPKTTLQTKCELLQGAAAKVMERVGTAKDPQTLSGLFEMRNKLVGLHQGVVDDASSALVTLLKKISGAPGDDLLHNIAASEEWREFMAAKRCAPRGWEQSEEIAKIVAAIIKRAASSIPSRKDLEGLVPEEDSDLKPEAEKSGVIEGEKAKLAKRLRDVSGDAIVAIPRVLGDQLLSEHYGDLAADLVAAIRSCEAIQLRSYNLWALSRIHASETASGWDGILAPIDNSYLQNVVATLYGDVSRRRLDAESQPALRAAKVRVMIRQGKIKPTNF